ncbi:NUDIX hydrolase [Macrococcus lamae]|uniref:NUDIX hydrolase n=1 Tax=Macrococcus lamae TaxID=198484 RepID=UPI0014087482|nr:NUDIX hydrolase [Macrococcus lamae]
MRKNKISSDDYKIFTVETIDLEINSQRGTFYQVAAPDWVTIIAETDGLFIVESQYRIGTEEVTLEFPGGVIERDEDAVRAAVRELKEETGYSGRPHVIGTMRPNPAFMTNRCTTVFIEQAELTDAPSPDRFEDITVDLMSLHDIEEAIADGRFPNALHIAALYQWKARR